MCVCVVHVRVRVRARLSVCSVCLSVSQSVGLALVPAFFLFFLSLILARSLLYPSLACFSPSFLLLSFSLLHLLHAPTPGGHDFDLKHS